MRGRPGCPTGQEKKPVGATGSNPLFYKERLGTKSPPHPPQCAHWGTYGLWWLRLDLTEQSPGLFDPRGEGFGGGKEAFHLGYRAALHTLKAAVGHDAVTGMLHDILLTEYDLGVLRTSMEQERMDAAAPPEE